MIINVGNGIDFTSFQLNADSSWHARRGKLTTLSAVLHLLEHENNRESLSVPGFIGPSRTS